MAYAIIETGGKQYQVQVGDEIFIEKLDKDGVLYEADAEITFDKVVALTNDAGEFKIGKPYLDGTAVKATLVKNGKDRKIIVFKYKPKKGYKKTKGHRQPYSKVKITAIG